MGFPPDDSRVLKPVGTIPVVGNCRKIKKAVIPDGLYVRGGEGNRTPDLLNAIQTLYQLSYTPEQQGDNSVKAENVSSVNIPGSAEPERYFIRG